MVGFQAQCRSGWCAGLEGNVKDEDAVVVRSEAKFILRADHAHRHLAPNLALFDLERIAFQGMAGGPHRGHDDFLTGRHIGRSADDGQWLSFAHIHRGHAKAVRVGVGLTGEHFSDNHALESSGNGRHFLQSFDLEAAGGQDVAHLLRVGGLRLREGQPGVDPIQRYFHDGRFGAGRANLTHVAPCERTVRREGPRSRRGDLTAEQRSAPCPAKAPPT